MITNTIRYVKSSNQTNQYVYVGKDLLNELGLRLLDDYKRTD